MTITNSDEWLIVAIDYNETIPNATVEGWFEDWLRRRGITFKRVEGSWEGERETSYVVPARLENQLWRTWCKNQQSMLLLKPRIGHEARRAELIWRDGRHEPIGFFQEVERDYALKQRAFTYDPTTETYYVAA